MSSIIDDLVSHLDLASLLIASFAAATALVRSGLVRAIVMASFRKPKSRSIIVIYKDELVVLDDVAADEQDRVLREFAVRHGGVEGEPPQSDVKGGAE